MSVNIREEEASQGNKNPVLDKEQHQEDQSCCTINNKFINSSSNNDEAPNNEDPIKDDNTINDEDNKDTMNDATGSSDLQVKDEDDSLEIPHVDVHQEGNAMDTTAPHPGVVAVMDGTVGRSQLIHYHFSPAFSSSNNIQDPNRNLLSAFGTPTGVPPKHPSRKSLLVIVQKKRSQANVVKQHSELKRQNQTAKQGTNLPVLMTQTQVPSTASLPTTLASALTEKSQLTTNESFSKQSSKQLSKQSSKQKSVAWSKKNVIVATKSNVTIQTDVLLCSFHGNLPMGGSLQTPKMVARDILHLFDTPPYKPGSSPITTNSVVPCSAHLQAMQAAHWATQREPDLNSSYPNPDNGAHCVVDPISTYSPPLPLVCHIH